MVHYGLSVGISFDWLCERTLGLTVLGRSTTAVNTIIIILRFSKSNQCVSGHIYYNIITVFKYYNIVWCPTLMKMLIKSCASPLGLLFEVMNFLKNWIILSYAIVTRDILSVHRGVFHHAALPSRLICWKNKLR